MFRTPLSGALLVLCLFASSFSSAADLVEGSPEAFVPIAEEVLDTAIEHCRRGERAQAAALFSAIKAQLNPPQQILDLILALERGGCLGSRPPKTRWELRAATGYDDNVSQGIRASHLTLGSSEYQVELAVDENYRPISSSFMDTTAGYSWQLADHLALQLKAGARHYPSVSTYDLTNANATLKARFDVLGRPIEFMGDWAELWLANHHYHSTWTMVAQTPVLPEAPQWMVTTIAQTVRYHTQPQQNATQLQFGVSRQLHFGSDKAALVGVLGLWDHALGQRAGRDRTGVNLHAAGQVRLQPWLLTGRIGITKWASRQDFLPGLVDEKRRNTLVQASLQAEYPLSSSQTLQFDLQVRNSSDTIVLYAYRSYSFGVSWGVRF